MMILAASVRKRFRPSCPPILKKQIRRVVRKGKTLFYRMDMTLFPEKMKRLCPCCGMRFRSFTAADFLNPKKYDMSRYRRTRQDVFCPVCRSMPRHRILAAWCDEHRESLRRAEILYFAPEYSMETWMKRNGVSRVTADLNGKADLLLDIQATGLPDESFDVIICNHVLEHVDDFRKAMKEVYRILRKGGTFICSFPMDPEVELIDEDPEARTEEERRLRFGQYDHKRVFGMKADRFLTEAGFTVKTVRGEDFPENILPATGPADYDINRLFFCGKTGKETDGK